MVDIRLQTGWPPKRKSMLRSAILSRSSFTEREAEDEPLAANATGDQATAALPWMRRGRDQGRSQIRHKYYNGVLELTLPKKNGSTARQLQVK